VAQAPQLALFVERSTQTEPLPTVHIDRPPSPHPATQAPSEQVVPRPQGIAQPPQFALSFWGFTHVAPQRRSPAAQAQTPALQVAPFGHWTPQALQLSVLLVVSTQLLLQFVSPAAHDSAHTPFEHTCPAAHTFPQVPQLFGSLCVWMHTLLQRIPFWHWQTPAWHVVPAAQRALHPPQLALFVERSRQLLPHCVVPPVHWQVPATHDSPDAVLHVTPHPPQLFGSAWSAMHAPLQYACPGGQVHTPPTHVEVAPHAFAQAPQLFGSVLRLTHPPLQIVGVAAAHVGEHAPFEQRSSIAPGGSGRSAQLWPHVPQFATFDRGFTHWPLQSDSPAGHTQTPAVHVVPPVHALPQRPQLPVSICSLTQASLQFVSGAMQVSTHAPFAQAGVAAGHTLPHRPQFLGSVLTFAQAPLHVVSGAHTSPSGPTSRTPVSRIVTTSGRAASAVTTASSVASPTGDASGDASGFGGVTAPSNSTSRSVRPQPTGAMAASMQSANAAKRKKCRAVFITPHPSRQASTRTRRECSTAHSHEKRETSLEKSSLLPEASCVMCLVCVMPRSSPRAAPMIPRMSKIPHLSRTDMPVHTEVSR
jgi:hypothetical protein